MKKISSLLLIGSFLIIVSCEKNNTQPDNKQHNKLTIGNNSTNNSSILVGSSIGDNSETLENIWKTGTVSIEKETNEFYINTVYFTRRASTSDYVYWIMPVRNVSGKSHAYIKAIGVRILDIDNNILKEGSFTYVEGSCGNSDLFVTNTFLRNNELGFFLGTDKIDFDQVAKIKVDSIKYNHSEFFYTKINVVPTSYRTSVNKVYVDVKNESDKTVSSSWLSHYILLDELNRPLGYGGFGATDNGIITLEPDSTGTLVDSIIYKGTCNKIKPILSLDIDAPWDLQSATLKCSTNDLTHDEFLRQTIINRNLRLKQQEELQ